MSDSDSDEDQRIKPKPKSVTDYRELLGRVNVYLQAR